MASQSHVRVVYTDRSGETGWDYVTCGWCERGCDGLDKYFSLCTSYSSPLHIQWEIFEAHSNQLPDPDLGGTSSGSRRKEIV
jgi:hypothetical protein